MMNRSSTHRLRLLAVLFLTLCVSGCGLSLGPQVEEETVYVRTNNVTGRVKQNKKIKVEFLDPKTGKTHTSKMDIGGMYVVSPDLMDEPKK